MVIICLTLDWINLFPTQKRSYELDEFKITKGLDPKLSLSNQGFGISMVPKSNRPVENYKSVCLSWIGVSHFEWFYDHCFSKIGDSPGSPLLAHFGQQPSTLANSAYISSALYVCVDSLWTLDLLQKEYLQISPMLMTIEQWIDESVIDALLIFCSESCGRLLCALLANFISCFIGIVLEMFFPSAGHRVTNAGWMNINWNQTKTCRVSYYSTNRQLSPFHFQWLKLYKFCQELTACKIHK